MVECVVCDIIEGKAPSKKLYEDDDVMVFLDVNGASKGHSFVVPKAHHPIFEQVPDDLIQKLFLVANKVSTALFESLNIQGTNVFVANGISAGQSVAHFVINVVPRMEGDGINLQWEPRQLSQEEMSTIELKIKEGTGSAEQVPQISEGQSQTMAPPQKKVSGKNNYLWKSKNRRVP